MKTLKLNPLALGVSLGIVWGVSIFIIGLVAHFFMYGSAFVSAMGIVYVGYGSSIASCINAAAIGFVDAFIIGALIGWLYNLFCGRGSKKTDE